jgi:hypothetical protein
MQRVELANWAIEFDKDATEAIFRRIPQGDPERCGCCYCRNFAACRQDVYPHAFRDFLASIGVDYAKESEVYECARLEDGRYYYGGCFHFIGKATKLVDADDERLITVGDFTCHLFNRRDLAHELFDKEPLVVEVLFEARVPWVLDEEEPGE